MEFGVAAVEVAKKIGEVAKKVADVQQKIDKATKPVEMTKKITDEKTGNYVGNEIAGKAINKVKVSLSESLNMYFEGKETINNNSSEDIGNKPIENNYKEVGLNNEKRPSIGDEKVGKLKLEDGLNNYLNSKELVEGSTENSLDKQTINNTNENDTTEVKRIPTRNEGLEGKNHPETGVPFVTKVVENSAGELVEVVVPEFDSEFEAQLPDEVCEANDNVQFDECNKQLKEEVENNPELREKFTDEQIEQILDGETPDGFTWHHDAEKGKVQLVDSEVHAKTGHTGGKSIWGGGTENR
jgi:hypothetical protein